MCFIEIIIEQADHAFHPYWLIAGLPVAPFIGRPPTMTGVESATSSLFKFCAPINKVHYKSFLYTCHIIFCLCDIDEAEFFSLIVYLCILS
jgi:hypothetical protein